MKNNRTFNFQFTKTFLLISVFFTMSVSVIIAQQKRNGIDEKPKLVVGIIVDQMKFGYISRYWKNFGEGGFKRLVNEGYQCNNTNYNYIPTYTGPGHASVYTGCTPSIHGIVGNDWFDRENRDTVYCVEDKTVKSVGVISVTGQMSPRNLLTTTFADELRLASVFHSKVISISMKDRSAILPGGHSGNGVYWYDGLSGNFISSTFYMNEIPIWVNDFNNKKLSEKYLSEPWNTLLPIEKYTASTVDDTPYEGKFTGELKPVFPHDFPKIRQGNFELIRKSPFGNTLTTDFALSAIDAEKLGTSSYTDFLAISFSCTDYVGHQFGTDAIETEDTYLRLDKDLAVLLTALDKKLGAGNYLFFLTADHAAIPNPQYLADHKMPAGFFEAKPMIDSLKKVLQKFYGDTSLFLNYDNAQIYLNQALVESKKINLKQMQNQIADFVVGFKGVSDAVSASRFNDSEFTTGLKHLVQMGYNRKRSGDVMLILEPGLLEWYSKTGTSHGSPYSYDTHVPLIWFGWNIQKGATSRYIEITDIAPTLSQLLNIEYPNGNIGKPIHELLK